MPATATKIAPPQPGEYAEYYHKYIALVPQGEITGLLEKQGDEFAKFLESVADADASIVHPPYGWTIKQVVSHIVDGDRIFTYRLLRIARGDKTPLPGFDEGEYAKTAGVEHLRLNDLVSEFQTVRAATISLVRNLPSDAWLRTGTANGYPVSVRALAWVMVGHLQHHFAIIRKRLAAAR